MRVATVTRFAHGRPHGPHRLIVRTKRESDHSPASCHRQRWSTATGAGVEEANRSHQDAVVLLARVQALALQRDGFAHERLQLRKRRRFLVDELVDDLR